MHYLYYVTFRKELAKSSDAARKYAANYLAAEGFALQGRFSRGMADWFVVGGRWSGELSRLTWAKELTAEIEKIGRREDIQVWGCSYGDSEKTKRQSELASRFQEMWNAAAPREYRGIPYCRDTYAILGHPDDAMIVTPELYDACLKEFEGQEDSDHHCDLEAEPISRDVIDKKWIVVVDYHN